MAKEIQKIYNNPNCLLSWPKVLIVDKGTKYIDHQEFEKHAFFCQDAMDLHLPLTDRSREWVVSLYINDDKYNDSPTKLIHISFNEAVKKSLESGKIFADPAVKHKRPIGYDEPLLSSDVKVQHLLEPGELEGWRRRATDCNWSP
ncbi:6675_t:CDS:2, partial [Cetraspora pellucida]